MSRYAVNKALWQVSRNDDSAAAYLSDPEEFVGRHKLEPHERQWLLERDFAGMFAAGVHPFLLYTFRIIVTGGWSWQLMIDHVEAIKHLEPPLDIST